MGIIASRANFNVSEMDKKELIGLGILLTVLGLLMFLLAYYLASSSDKSREKAVANISASAQSCKSNLETLGFATQEKNGHFLLNKPGMSDPTLKLGESSVAVLACPGWDVVNFCAGEGCEFKNGVTLEIAKK